MVDYFEFLRFFGHSSWIILLFSTVGQFQLIFRIVCLFLGTIVDLSCLETSKLNKDRVRRYVLDENPTEREKSPFPTEREISPF